MLSRADMRVKMTPRVQHLKRAHQVLRLVALTTRQSLLMRLAINTERAEGRVREEQFALMLGHRGEFRRESWSEDAVAESRFWEFSHLIRFEFRCLQAQNVSTVLFTLRFGLGSCFAGVKQRTGGVARAFSCECELWAAELVERMSVVAPVVIPVFSAEVKRRAEFCLVEVTLCAKKELGRGVLGVVIAEVLVLLQLR